MPAVALEEVHKRRYKGRLHTRQAALRAAAGSRTQARTLAGEGHGGQRCRQHDHHGQQMPASGRLQRHDPVGLGRLRHRHHHKCHPAQKGCHAGQRHALPGYLLQGPLVDRIMGLAIGIPVALGRLGREQHGDHPHQHGYGHGQIAHGPALVVVAGAGRRIGALGPGRQAQHTGAGADHGYTVAGLVVGGQHGLPLHRGRFDAERIERNILRGRGKGHQQRQLGQRFHASLGRVVEGHADQAAHDGELGHQQPAAAPAQPARQQRNRQPVHQRRPDPLEAIGQCHPAQEADGGTVDTGLAQTEAQRAQHQQQRQASREAQRQHAQAGRFEIDTQGLRPAQPGCSGNGRGVGHRFGVFLLPPGTQLQGFANCRRLGRARAIIRALCASSVSRATLPGASTPPCRLRNAACSCVAVLPSLPRPGWPLPYRRGRRWM